MESVGDQMKRSNIDGAALAGAVWLVAACLLATVCGVSSASQTTPSRVAADAASVDQGSLLANVYLQTSAEYRACCHGIYTAAGSRLEELLEDADPRPARPAVVMDIDETVLDNSSFQTFLYVNGLEYSDELWDDFERRGVGEVALVPGAKEFIDRAEALGVTVIYLSNRNERNLRWTAQALEAVGLGAAGLADRLYLRPEGASSDKSPRRDVVTARYNVLMYFGDNLRDFSEVFAAGKLSDGATDEERVDAVAARATTADDAVCHWGIDWFVLPNPVYGEWEKLASPIPEAILRPTDMKVGQVER